jgi:hypothetical protein
MLIVFALGLLIGSLGTIAYNYDNVRRTIQNLEWYQTYHLVKSGWAMGFGLYYLVSLDGGKNWHEANREEGEVKIIGPANPELLAYLDGMDRLTRHVLTNGPIGSRPITDEDISLLQGAGFTVTQEP